jgi:hypothetical protein
VGRARPAGGHDHEGLVDRGRQAVGLEHAGGVLRDRPHDVELVVDVVEETEVLADAGPVHLAGEEQHG